MDLVAGAIVAGRFRLMRELGQGGMGSVWLAQDSSLDTPCAIKFIHGQAAENQQMRARFEREAKSAAQLRSPNVVQILDHGVSDGIPYIAMELLEGEDLDQRLRRVGRLGLQETFYIISQVAKALSKASQAGLVHRDLKPANIYLVRDEDRDIPKVLDFGVAKSSIPELADSSTKTGALMGTPFYMSPEQTRGKRDIDHRSDLWALAVIVFQCVSGRLPFLSDSLGDLIFKIGTDPIPVPSQVAPDLPPAFDQWWERAAQRDPALRFQTPKEFVDSLAVAFGIGAAGQFAQVSGAGAYHPSGMSWGTGSQPGAQRPSTPPVPAVTGQPMMQTGVTSTSIAEKAAPRKNAGLIVGVIAAVAVAGGVAYAVAGRTPHPAPIVASPGPSAPSASAPQPPSTTVVTPVVTASATATVAQTTPPPPETASAQATGNKVPVKGPLNTTKKAGPGPTSKPIVPNDGI